MVFCSWCLLSLTPEKYMMMTRNHSKELVDLQCNNLLLYQLQNEVLPGPRANMNMWITAQKLCIPKITTNLYLESGNKRITVWAYDNTLKSFAWTSWENLLYAPKSQLSYTWKMVINEFQYRLITMHLLHEHLGRIFFMLQTSTSCITNITTFSTYSRYYLVKHG